MFPTIHRSRVLTGSVSALLAADGSGFQTQAVEQFELDLEGVLLPGVTQDRHRGHGRRADSRVPWHPRGALIRNARQLSLVCPNELQEAAAALGAPELRPEWLGANMAISGVPRFSMLPRGTRLMFPSGATLAVDDQNAPCRKAGAAVARHLGGDRAMPFAFVKAAARRRGLVAWVERAGVVRRGDAVKARIPEQWIYD